MKLEFTCFSWNRLLVTNNFTTRAYGISIYFLKLYLTNLTLEISQSISISIFISISYKIKHTLTSKYSKNNDTRQT